MKKRLWFVLLFSFVAVINSTAQERRTVTNADLEKYRQKRVAAERDLRENYARLGFPSPEELEKQIEQSRAERSALAARLEAENLRREQVNLERQRAVNEARVLNYQTSVGGYQNYGGGYFYNYAPSGFYGFPGYGFPNSGFFGGGYNRFDRGGFGGKFRRNYGGHLRFEYRNNLPVRVQPPPRRILAPR